MSRYRHIVTTLRTPLGKLQLLGIVALIGVIIFSAEAISRMNGGTDIVGLSPTTSGGCSCHGGSSSSATTLSASSGSGSFTVEPGSTTAFTVNVSHASQAAAGVNIAVKTAATGTTNAGTLSVATGSGLQVVSSEITHNSPKAMSSGTAAFTFSWTAPSEHGTYYLQAIGNAVNGNSQNSGDFWNWMSAQAITVPGVTLTSPNGNANYCTGSNVTISWTSTAVTNVKIELSADGGSTWPTTIVASTAASAGSYTWTVPASVTAGTNYRIRVSDASTSTRLDASDASFSISTLPAITTQPTAQTACVGQPASFTVTATGSNLSYQWRHNGANIAGATSATYSITSAQATMAGNYDVQVSNACTTVTSNTVALTVNAPPAITTQPVPQTACVGQSASFSVSATGEGLTYQWRRNGTNIAGATSATYSITSVATGDAGNYDVVVSGTCAPARTSNAAALTVNQPPTITTNPTLQAVCAGQAASFSVTATGTNLTYQWRRNGTNITGAIGATYTIPIVGTVHAGNYDVVVSGTCSPTATSTAATLTVNPSPTVTSDPAPMLACEGEEATFTVGAAGADLRYQWRLNGTDIAGATSATYTVDEVATEHLGAYDVIVTQGDCFTISNSAMLSMMRPAEITGEPTDKSGVVGSTIELAVTAAGDELSYVWRKGSVPVPGATGATLRLTNVKVSDAGTYSVEVRNTCTTLTSRPVTVSVLEPGAGALLSLSPSTVDFGASRIGLPQERTLTDVIRNAGDSVLTITQLAITGANAAEFALGTVSLPITVAPGESSTLTVRFTPTSAGAKSATVTFTSNSKTPATLALVGEGATGALTAPVPTVNFGGVATAESRDSTIALCNNSEVPVTIESFQLLGSTPFSVVAPAVVPLTVPPGGCIDLTIRFTPTASGEATDILTVRTDGQPATLTIGLSGTGGVTAAPIEARVVESLSVMPNPATEAVSIAMTLARPLDVEVSVVDARGAVVHRFASKESAGEHRFVWNGRGDGGELLPSGTYRIVARAGGQVSSTAIVIVR